MSNPRHPLKSIEAEGTQIWLDADDAARYSAMADEPESHRVYHSIKAMILSNELAEGERIPLEPLADRLFISVTPVREALIQLAAERLVRDVPKAGFFAKELSEAETRNLLTMNRLLLDWSLSVAKGAGEVPGMLKPPKLFREVERPREPSPQLAVEVMNVLFLHIARQSGNPEIVRLVRNANERTQYVRMKACEHLGDPGGQLLWLCLSYHRKDITCLRRDLSAYLERHTALLPDLIRLIRGSGNATRSNMGIPVGGPRGGSMRGSAGR